MSEIAVGDHIIIWDKIENTTFVGVVSGFDIRIDDPSQIPSTIMVNMEIFKSFVTKFYLDTGIMYVCGQGFDGPNPNWQIDHRWLPIIPIIENKEHSLCPCSGECCDNPDLLNPKHECSSDGEFGVCEGCFVNRCNNCNAECSCDL